MRFRTPTELTGAGVQVAQPDFACLVTRLRDRLSNLSRFYGPGPLDLDFRAMGQRAAMVRLVNSDVRIVHAERISGRTGQRQPLGGIVGAVEYEGDLTEFVPFLQAGYWTGVGKKTVWGNGQLEVLKYSHLDAKVLQVSETC